jgi:hypothetical protein
MSLSPALGVFHCSVAYPLTAMNNSLLPDLDGIARNLIALDLAHLSPEESAAYEHELSAITSLNDALETTISVLRIADPPECWHRLYPLLCDAAALLSSQLAPLLDTNAERAYDLQLTPTPTAPPLAIVHPSAMR